MSSNPELQLKRFGWLLHFAALAILCAASYLLWSFVAQPMQQKLNFATQESLILNRFLKQGSRIVNKEVNLKQQLQASQSQLAALQDRVPSSQNTTEFFEIIDLLAKEVGFTVLNYESQSVRTQATHSEIPLAVSGRGDFKSLSRFVAGLSKLPRLCRIRELRVTSNHENGEYPVTMGLSIYYTDKEQTTALINMIGTPVIAINPGSDQTTF